MKIFSFFSFLFSFMIFKAVDDAGAGNDDGVDTDDKSTDKDDVDGSDSDNNSDKDSKDDVDDTQSELERLREIVDANEAKKAVQTIISEIKTRHGDFDEDKIVAYLEELKATNPARAEALNNPVGWELIHTQEFTAKEVENDFFNHGRGGEHIDRTDELLEKVEKGGISRAEEAVVLSKYL